MSERYTDATEEETKEVLSWACYSDIRTISDEREVELQWDNAGPNRVIRFKQKPLMRWISDNIDINEMWRAYYNGEIAGIDLRQFYRDMGYSLAGYQETWQERWREEHGLEEEEE